MHEGEIDGVPFHLNGGPVVTKGKVIIGTSLGINTGGGNFIVGLDAAAGRADWQRSMAFQHHCATRRAGRR
jgi:hypothetical protein